MAVSVPRLAAPRRQVPCRIEARRRAALAVILPGGVRDWGRIVMNWKLIFTLLGVIAVISVTLAALLLTAVHRRLRRLRVPSGADFFTTVRAVPLALVVGLDLLDLGLDMLSAPII